jgi:hypothetical protein
MLGNLGIAAAAICILSGVFLSYSGIAALGHESGVGCAALLSVGLVTALLITTSKLEWSRTFERYRERSH